MRSNQLEFKIMPEIPAESIHAIVAGKTVRAIFE